MKKWYNSKTVWFSIAQMLGGIGGLIEEFASAGDFSEQAFVLFLLGIATYILRRTTTEPIR